MMDFNEAEIRELTLDEIAGLITKEQREYLYHIIGENQEAFKLWQQLHLDLGPQQIQEARETMLNPSEIIHKSKAKHRKLLFLSTISVAATVILLAMGAWYFFFIPNRQQSKAPLAVNVSKHVQLRLPSGEIFELSGDNQQIQAGRTTLHNNNKTLRYAADPPLAGLSTLLVPVGKDYNIVLSDGTEIQLNSATKLSFPLRFTGSTREVSISGEAYLKVAYNPHKPFVVNLPDSNSVHVLGTGFNVNSYDPGIIKVALVQGAISMHTQTDSVLLKPGNEIVSTAGKAIRVHNFDEEEVLSWRKGIYEFNLVPLPEICKVLSRWYGVNVIMDNESVEKKRFLGSISRDTPLQQFLKNLQFSDSSIRYYFDDMGILHFK